MFLKMRVLIGIAMARSQSSTSTGAADIKWHDEPVSLRIFSWPALKSKSKGLGTLLYADTGLS